MPSARQKFLVLGLSLATSLAFSLWLWRKAKTGAESVLIDNRAEVEDLLNERALTAPAEEVEESWPPPLIREPLSQAAAAKLYPALKRPGYEYDPICGLRRTSGLNVRRSFELHPRGGWQIRTNDLGLREDVNPGPVPAERCYLILGDSQTEGVCANRESYPNCLEALLRQRKRAGTVSVWNGGMGGTGPYHYLASLERLFVLEPTVVIAMFYGGNDFMNAVSLEHYFRRRKPPKAPLPLYEEGDSEGAIPEAIGFAELGQLAFFARNEDKQRLAVGTCAAVALEMRRLCREKGARFVCAYLPPPLCAQPELYAVERAGLERRLVPRGIDLELSNRLADEWMELLATQEMAVIDLRPALRSATTRLFWENEWHLNLEGNLLLAQTLFHELQQPEQD